MDTKPRPDTWPHWLTLSLFLFIFVMGALCIAEMRQPVPRAGDDTADAP